MDLRVQRGTGASMRERRILIEAPIEHNHQVKAKVISEPTCSRSIALSWHRDIKTMMVVRERSPEGLTLLRPLWYSLPQTSRTKLAKNLMVESLPTTTSSRLSVAHVHLGSPLWNSGGKKNTTVNAQRVEVKSSITGRIVQVNIKKGVKVSKGACLVIIEAMKMENKIFSPMEGKVRSVAVKEGEGTAVGKVLCVLDPISTS